MNRYDLARWVGAAFVLLGVAALAFTYPPHLSFAVQLAAFTVAGVLFVLAGTSNQLRERFGPHRLMGVGDVLLGGSIVVSAFSTSPDAGGIFYLVAVGLGGASLAFIGLAYVFRPSSFGLGEDGYPVE